MEYNQCTRSARWTTLQTYSRSMSQHKQTPPQGWAFEPTQQPTLWWNLEKIQQTCVLAVLRSPRLLCVYHSYLQGVKFVLHVLRFHSGWMEVPNPIVCVCCFVFGTTMGMSSKTEMAQTVTGMYGGEWWMMKSQWQTQQRTFFSRQSLLSPAWIPNQTSARRILKGVLVKEKLNTFAVSGKETIIFLSASC